MIIDHTAIPTMDQVMEKKNAVSLYDNKLLKSIFNITFYIAPN